MAGTLFENNLSPYLTIVEATEPAAPAAGQQRLYIDSTTHLLKATNSSGTDRTIEGAASGAITSSGLTQTTARILGRTTASTGAIEEITVGSGLSLSAGSLTATGGSGGALVLLQTQTASSSATLDYTTSISATYDEYLIEFLNVIPVNNAAVLWMRMSTDGGSTYDSGTVYDYTSGYAYSGGVGVGSSGTSSTKILLMDAASNSSTYGICGQIRLFSPGSTSVYKLVLGDLLRWDSGGALGLVRLSIVASYNSATAVNAFRFLMDTGNIASGIIRVYGVAKA